MPRTGGGGWRRPARRVSRCGRPKSRDERAAPPLRPPGRREPNRRSLDRAPRWKRRATLTPLEEAEFDRDDPWTGGVVFAWVPFDGDDPAQSTLDERRVAAWWWQDPRPTCWYGPDTRRKAQRAATGRRSPPPLEACRLRPSHLDRRRIAPGPAGRGAAAVGLADPRGLERSLVGRRPGTRVGSAHPSAFHHATH